MTVSVCIASRGRPALCRQTADTLLAGAVLDDTRLAVALDCDDPELAHYALPARCTVSIADREDSLGAKWNRAYRHANADVAVLWADDMVMPDKGWDRALAAAANALPDQCGAIFFGSIPGILQPGIAVTRKFAEAMGFFAVPYFPFWWVDTWIMECATMSGRSIAADVKVTLINDVKGSSRGVRDIRFWAELFDRLRPARVTGAERIIREGSETPERKASLLLALPQWVEHWNNSNSVLRDPVRAAEIEQHYSFDAPADERYARLKATADAMLAELPA